MSEKTPLFEDGVFFLQKNKGCAMIATRSFFADTYPRKTDTQKMLLTLERKEMVAWKTIRT